MPKTLTRRQLQARKDKAVRFVRDVLGDDDRADEIEDESLESYADRRKIRLANPRVEGGECDVARKPTAGELREENDQLWDALENIYDQVGDLLGVEEEEEEDESGEDEE